MEYRHQYDEIVKHFAEGRLKEAGAIQKDLQLHNVNIASYYTDIYALWLDFRTIDDNMCSCGRAVKVQGWDAEGPGFEASRRNCLHT